MRRLTVRLAGIRRVVLSYVSCEICGPPESLTLLSLGTAMLCSHSSHLKATLDLYIWGSALAHATQGILICRVHI